ncbi:magnesium/cobalt transporter CorA [Geobacter sulfurreducens]|jgi:magnesium transporter|uniref:Magnesium transport protein CorA n=1 Tax=Geobacter sulfurreducens (strain ATCC 51573 / DSM 12127 / PCA) TaxID=243231 RepID=Q74DB7_GEOSL|nr:magnesium/cobalt transporter CorA [Geobacter sulfurreducens]AAR34775.1 magnesium transport protein CorA [Geobacter sulfurreducens PCA]ADI84239.1 magnesium transport protein CorA [Geobacter sulfurreducens KN400]QVW36584.1 magnesium/cobalt transporter CorA [Geobacter sulfurreducens]UAC05419.1 magnesium/cobalt transporter CorA [Geobacter sulfurreducens]UTG94051.1 magnesium/cobalt transporter CorA [Geobacter sulfurreducens]
MKKIIKQRSRKTGLPPGSLVHIGEQTGEPVRISLVDYDETSISERETDDIAECFPHSDQPGVRWLDMEGIHRPELLKTLGECYGIHPLTLEDILNTDQRPKLEDFDDYLFVVLKMLSLQPDGSLTAEQVSFVLGPSFLISFQEGFKGDLFDSIRRRLRENRGKLRKSGSDFLLYSLMDAIVDYYFVILEDLAERIEELEEEVIAGPSRKTVVKIQHLKRETIFLRKSVWPLREVLGRLERRESPLVRGETVIYLRDVYDHCIQIIETVETFRDLLSEILDIYLSAIGNRTNEVMKVLTIIATIFMPLTFIAGVYGMNFRYMPELEWHWGYPAVLLLMLLVSLGMGIFFRRKRWL